MPKPCVLAGHSDCEGAARPILTDGGAGARESLVRGDGKALRTLGFPADNTYREGGFT